MKRVILTLDGALVIGLGLYMLLLSQAEAYAAFMNPKFRPLTAAAAVGLCVLGGAFLIRPGGSTDARRTLCFAILGVLVLHAGGGSFKGSAGFALKPPPEIRTDPDPHVARNGETYLKSNPARLFLSLQTGQAAPSDQRYVTRGVVKHSALVPDPEAITQQFNREFAAMMKAVRSKPEVADTPAPPKGAAAPHHAAARTANKVHAAKRAPPRRAAA